MIISAAAHELLFGTFGEWFSWQPRNPQIQQMNCNIRKMKSEVREVRQKLEDVYLIESYKEYNRT